MLIVNFSFLIGMTEILVKFLSNSISNKKFWPGVNASKLRISLVEISASTVICKTLNHLPYLLNMYHVLFLVEKQASIGKTLNHFPY